MPGHARGFSTMTWWLIENPSPRMPGHARGSAPFSSRPTTLGEPATLCNMLLQKLIEALFVEVKLLEFCLTTLSTNFAYCRISSSQLRPSRCCCFTKWSITSLKWLAAWVVLVAMLTGSRQAANRRAIAHWLPSSIWFRWWRQVQMQPVHFENEAIPTRWFLSFAAIPSWMHRQLGRR